MQVSEFLKQVLFSAELGAKLYRPESLEDDMAGRSAVEGPELPGRPKHLEIGVGKSSKGGGFSQHRLANATDRGRIFHSFANHELLALELMALTLLRFPKAPTAFRRSLIATMLEEQEHLQLYIRAMEERGVGFGDFAVNGFFWNSMSGAKTLSEFLSMMSLTFEQANLDYCLHYRDALRDVGDDGGADVLQQVYDDEIGHVRVGLEWFHQWREQGQSLWDSYRQALPHSMTPERAKGIGFDFAGREAAGLPKDFVDRLYCQGGKPGVRPTLWSFNLLGEMEVEREVLGKGSVPTPARLAGRFRDLEQIAALLVPSHDVAKVQRVPGMAQQRLMTEVGIAQPLWMEGHGEGYRLSGFQPWIWTKASQATACGLGLSGEDGDGRRKLVERFADKRKLKDLEQQVVARWRAQEIKTAFAVESQGEVASSVEEVVSYLEHHDNVIVKTPFGVSGRGAMRLTKKGMAEHQRSNWLDGAFKVWGQLVIEPGLQRLADFSIQLHVGRSKRVTLRQTFVDAQGQFFGQLCGDERLWLPDGDGALGTLQRYSPQGGLWRSLRLVGESIAEMLAAEGYQGPANVDAFVGLDGGVEGGEGAGRLVLRPACDLNVRFSFGMVGVAAEKALSRKSRGVFALMPKGQLAWSRDDTVFDGEGRLMAGWIPLNDLEQAEDLVAVLVASDGHGECLRLLAGLDGRWK